MDQKDFRELLRAVSLEQAKLSSSSFYFTGDDHLRVRSFGSVEGAVVTLRLRFLNLDGRVQAWEERHTPNSDRSEATSLHTLGEGFLLNAAVSPAEEAHRAGELFVLVEVVRGRTGAIQSLACLIQGYVVEGHRLAWPGAPHMRSVDGPGVLRFLAIETPDPGDPLTIDVPEGARWRLHSFTGELTTSVDVANREALLIISNDGIGAFSAAAGEAQTASLARTYVFAAFGHKLAASQGSERMVGIPCLPLPGETTIELTAENIEAADQFDAGALLVEEWIEP